jgi:hypothetical protein
MVVDMNNNTTAANLINSMKDTASTTLPHPSIPSSKQWSDRKTAPIVQRNHREATTVRVNKLPCETSFVIIDGRHRRQRKFFQPHYFFRTDELRTIANIETNTLTLTLTLTQNGVFVQPILISCLSRPFSTISWAFFISSFTSHVQSEYRPLRKSACSVVSHTQYPAASSGASMKYCCIRSGNLLASSVFTPPG